MFARAATRASWPLALTVICLLVTPARCSAQLPVVAVPIGSIPPGGGPTLGLPEIPGSPEGLIISITGAIFTPPGPIPSEVDILGDGGISDRILFDNSSGFATITFLSDDEAGILPPHAPYPLLIPPVPGESASVFVGGMDTSGPTPFGVLFSFLIVSDNDPPIQGQSDTITISIVPEPNSAFLAIASLVAVHRDRETRSQVRAQRKVSSRARYTPLRPSAPQRRRSAIEDCRASRN